ncbi:hypothetical protein EI94DRAFT_1745755 [Lactarius quietus]|nr:hypothetical protein EI94DRAFT_1745755 [Lactarius quietus]
MRHFTHFPLSRFQVVVAVFLASVSGLTTAQAKLKEIVPMYPAWLSAGCHNDSNHAVRALNKEVTVPGGQSNASVENCIGKCWSLNFVAAGLEQHRCWCGNSFSPGTGAQIDINKCNTPCTGDPTEWCGGHNALLVYYFLPLE